MPAVIKKIIYFDPVNNRFAAKSPLVRLKRSSVAIGLAHSLLDICPYHMLNQRAHMHHIRIDIRLMLIDIYRVYCRRTVTRATYVFLSTG